jgi:hypothetical protein
MRGYIMDGYPTGGDPMGGCPNGGCPTEERKGECCRLSDYHEEGVRKVATRVGVVGCVQCVEYWLLMSILNERRDWAAVF